MPVLHEGRIVGIITRTDVIRSLHQSLPLVHRGGRLAEGRRIYRQRSWRISLARRLPGRVHDILRRAGETGMSWASTSLPWVGSCEIS